MNLTNKNNKNNYFLLILIFLYSLNLEIIIIPISLMIIIYAIFLKKINLSWLFIICFTLLLSFLILFNLIGLSYGFIELIQSISKILLSLSFFYIGYMKTKHFLDFSPIYSFILGISIYSYLSVIETLKAYGSFDNLLNISGGRNVLKFGGEGLISATALTAFLSFNLALIAIVIIKEVKFKFKLLIILNFCISLWIINGISSRTGILIVPISIILNFLFATNKLNIKLRQLIFIIIGALSIIIIYNINLFDVKNKVKNSLLFNRLTTSKVGEDSRFDMWGIVLNNSFKSIMGGRESYLSQHYAHNMWLDCLYDTGFFPTIILIIISITFLMIAIKNIFNANDVLYSTLLISITIAFYIIFMFEPVLQGLNNVFMIYCFLFGKIIKDYSTRRL